MRKIGYRVILILSISSLIWIVGLNSVRVCFGFGGKEDGGVAGTYLFWGGGARSLGIGRAYTGGCDDASSVYWNPAGLGLMKRNELIAAYSFLGEDTGYSFLSVGIPTRRAVVGLGVVDLRSLELDRRNRDNEDIGEFDISQSAWIISSSKRIYSTFYLGGSIKIVHESINGYSDTGYGVDLGMMYEFRPVSVGLYLGNVIKPVIKLNKKEEKFPLDGRLGVRYRIKERLDLSMDGLKIEGRDVKMFYGAEYRLSKDLISVRMGINESEITSGLGVKISDFQLDYAFIYRNAWERQSEIYYPHRIGISIKWGGVGLKTWGNKKWWE